MKSLTTSDVVTRTTGCRVVVWLLSLTDGRFSCAVCAISMMPYDVDVDGLVDCGRTVGVVHVLRQ